MTRLPCDFDISNDVELLVKRSGVELDKFQGKTLLITGATGFFGLWFLSALTHIRARINGSLRIIALSRSPEKFLQQHNNQRFSDQVEFIQGDVQHFELPSDIQVTHLIHMATTNASETFAGEDQLNKLEMLYNGTRHVLEQCGNSLENVLFTSSGVAYGINPHEVIAETDFTAPDTTDDNSALGLGKLVAEYLTAHFAAKFGYRYSIARCFAFAGEYLPMDLHYAFGNFVRNALNHEDIVIKGDGQDRRSYLYIGDAIAWLLRMLSEPKNQMFNVGSSNSVSIEHLARIIATTVTPPVGISILGKNAPTGNFRRASYTPKTNKVFEHYPGLAEWTPLNQVVEKMLEC